MLGLMTSQAPSPAIEIAPAAARIRRVVRPDREVRERLPVVQLERRVADRRIPPLR